MARKQPAKTIVLKLRLMHSLGDEARARLARSLQQAADIAAVFDQLAAVLRRARASKATQERPDVE